MISIGETFQGALDDFKKNSKVMVGTSAIGLAISSLVGVLGALALSAGGGTVATVAVVVLTLTVAMFFSLGMVGLSLKVVRGQRPKIADLFGEARSLPKAMASIISHMILGLGATAPLAFIPTVGPVLYFVAAMGVLSLTCLAPYYLVDKKQGPLRALWSAFKDTKGNRLAVMGLLFASTLFMAASAVVPVVGPLIATPIFSLALARAYTGVTDGNSTDALSAPGSLAELEPPLPQVSDEQVEATLKRFENELRDEGKLPT